MGITSKVCSLFSKNARENADIERRLQSSKELAESFYRDPLIAQYQEYQISDMFSSLEIDAARGIENVPNTGVLTVEQLKVQKRLQNEFLKNMRKLPKAGLSEIYLKSEVFKINPTMKKAFQTILSSNDTANGRNLVGDATIQRVVQRLKMASNEYEVGSVAQKVKGQLGLSGRNKLLRLNNMYTKIARGDKEFEGQTGPTAAESFYLKGNESGKVSEKVFIDGQNVFSESLDFLTKKGELKALRDFSILSIADNNTYQKLLKDKNIDANVKEASKDFRTLGKQRDADVLKGIKRLSGLIKNSKDIALTSSMKYNKVINALEGFSKNVEARMQSKDSGTLPILTLEILPQIEASFYKAFSGEASKVDDAMNGFLALDDILEKNLYTSKVIKNDLNVLNRSYFPQVDLENLDEKSKDAIIKEIQEDFQAAQTGITQLPLVAKLGVYTAYSYYFELLVKLKKTQPSILLLNILSLSVISLLAIVLNFFGFMVYYTFGSETSLITFVILLIFYISITYKISKDS